MPDTACESAVGYRPEYAFDQSPSPARVIEVADGVLWLRMPLPFALDHINLWVLADGDGWTIVDTGIRRDETINLWCELFAEPLASRRAQRLICTHFHPDHFGLAGWLSREHGLPLTMTRGEWIMGRMLCLDGEGAFTRAMAEFFASHGLSDKWTTPLASRGNVYATRVETPPASFIRIVNDEQIEIGGRSWRVIVGTGHAPEHATLYCRDLGVLISGDQILPRITSNIGVWASEPESNPLADFLGSLDRFRDLPRDTLVLPSHGRPFRGLHGRLDELVEHHDQRLDDVVAACTDSKTAADILPVLFRRELDGHQMVFAMGESIAHLSYLVADGRLTRTRDADGLFRFRSATP